MFKLPESNEDFRRLVKIVEANKIYSVDKISNYLAKSQSKSLTKNDVQEIKKDFKSDQYGFDEIYKVKLAVIEWLVNIDQKSDEFVRFLDWDSKNKYKMESVGIKIPEDFYSKEYADDRRKALRSYGESLLKITKEEIEARLAILEIFARLIPDELIPELLLICPKYLGCKIIQAWIMNNQFYSIHGDDQQKALSKDRVKKFTKALIPDGRKNKKQSTYYWQLDGYYNKLTNYIKGHRLASKEGRLDKEYLKIFFDVWKIPDVYLGHFTSEEIGAKDLALEIMISKGMITSEISFRDFQPKINRLKEKHSGIQMTLVLEDILDLPIQFPQMLDNPKIWNLLA